MINELENFQICDQDLDAALLDQYLQASSIAVDTETMGLNYQRDRLCLVQLCAPGLVTIIRIALGQTSAPNLQRLMAAAHITKVFHFARFDVAQLAN
jgi:ribonuclease D